MTVLRLKEKLLTHVGTSVSAMRLQLRDDRGALVAALDDDARPLGFYSPRDGWTLHVVDTDVASASAHGWLDDVSKVKKAVMSDDEYAARDNTYRKFKADKQAAEPGWSMAGELAKRRGEAPAEAPTEDTGGEAASRLALGSRCEVAPGAKRGVLVFLGRPLPGSGLPAGWWAGVRFDEPVGKGDGSLAGVRFFDAQPGYGSLVRPDRVACGDFPEIDEFADDEPDEI